MPVELNSPQRRPIVGWCCSDRCDPDLILGAPEYAVSTRNVPDGLETSTIRRFNVDQHKANPLIVITRPFAMADSLVSLKRWFI